jgi:hypothetical protein
VQSTSGATVAGFGFCDGENILPSQDFSMITSMGCLGENASSDSV